MALSLHHDRVYVNARPIPPHPLIVRQSEIRSELTSCLILRSLFATKYQRTKKRLDECVLLCERKRIDPRPQCILGQLPNSRKFGDRKPLRVTTMIEHVVDVDVNFGQCLHASQFMRLMFVAELQQHTFLHLVIEGGTGSISQSRHSRCQPSSLFMSVPK